MNYDVVRERDYAMYRRVVETTEIIASKGKLELHQAAIVERVLMSFVVEQLLKKESNEKTS